MKKITTIFLAAFLLGACTDNGTPSGGAGSMSNSSFPKTFTMPAGQKALFFADGKLQGFLPLIFKPNQVPNGYKLEAIYDALPDEIDIQTTGFIVYGNGGEFTSTDNLFDGHEANYKDPKFDGITTNNDSNLNYIIEAPNSVEGHFTGFSAAYEQTSATTFKRTCYVKAENGNILETDPKGCEES